MSNLPKATSTISRSAVVSGVLLVSIVVVAFALQNDRRAERRPVLGSTVGNLALPPTESGGEPLAIGRREPVSSSPDPDVLQVEPDQTTTKDAAYWEERFANWTLGQIIDRQNELQDSINRISEPYFDQVFEQGTYQSKFAVEDEQGRWRSPVDDGAIARVVFSPEGEIRWAELPRGEFQETYANNAELAWLTRQKKRLEPRKQTVWGDDTELFHKIMKVREEHLRAKDANEF